MSELHELIDASNAVKPDEVIVETWYAVFNDPAKIAEKVAAGMPEELADKLREPLYQAPVPGSAKRFMLWTNENRDQHGLTADAGHAVLRKQTVTTTPWLDVVGDELNQIDEGRRAYG